MKRKAAHRNTGPSSGAGSKASQTGRRAIWILLLAAVIVAAVVFTFLAVQRRMRLGTVVVHLDPQLPSSVADVFESALVDAGSVGRADKTLALGVRRGSGARAASVTTADTLQSFAARLRSFVGNERVPLAVAGDEPAHFAALVLYLAGELLPPEEAQAVEDALVAERTVSDAAAGDAVAGLLDRLEPVRRLLTAWKTEGLLPRNWTNWDAGALRAALRERSAVFWFAPRSLVGAMPWEERISLHSARLPAGEGRRRFRMIGQAVTVTPGPVPRADAAEVVRTVARTGDVQLRLEQETPWSSVAIGTAPLNAEHRDLVRWITGAGAYIVVDADTAAHPVFRSLHVALR